MSSNVERRHQRQLSGYHHTMSNTLIILAVLGVINFLIKKFASKPVDPAGNENERPDARPIQSSAPASQQLTPSQRAARAFNDQARALGLIDE